MNVEIRETQIVKRQKRLTYKTFAEMTAFCAEGKGSFRLTLGFFNIPMKVPTSIALKSVQADASSFLGLGCSITEQTVTSGLIVA